MAPGTTNGDGVMNNRGVIIKYKAERFTVMCLNRIQAQTVIL